MQGRLTLDGVEREKLRIAVTNCNADGLMGGVGILNRWEKK